MSFFRGLAGGFTRGTTEFLASEDARMEADMKASMAEYKRRIEKQTDKRDARKKELIDSIGGFTSRGYSIETASQALEKFGSKGAARLLTQADAAKAAGTSYEDFIVEVAGPGSPTDPKTAQDLATELAYRELPTIESSALNAPRPFGGDTSILSNLIRGDGDPSTSPDQVDQMLKRFGASLPDQSREQTFTLPSDMPEGMEDLTEVDPTPQQSSFTVNRNLIPTDESRRLAKLPFNSKMDEFLVSKNPEERKLAQEYFAKKKSLEEGPLDTLKNTIIELGLKANKTADETANLERASTTLKNLTTMLNPTTPKPNADLEKAMKVASLVNDNLKTQFNRKSNEGLSGEEIVVFTTPGGTREIKVSDAEFNKVEQEYNVARATAKSALLDGMNLDPHVRMYVSAPTKTDDTTTKTDDTTTTTKKGDSKTPDKPAGALSEKEYTDRMESALVAFKEGTATIDTLVNGTEVVVLDDISIPVAELRAYEVEMEENFDDLDASNDLLAFNEKDANEEVEAIKDAISSTTGAASLFTKPADKQAREIEIAETQSTVLEKLRVKLNKRNYTEQEQQEIVNATAKYMRAARTGNPFQPGPARSYFKELESLLSTIKELMQKKRKP